MAASQMLPPEPASGASFFFDADALCTALRRAGQVWKTESELQTACLRIIGGIFDANDVTFEPALSKYIRVSGRHGGYSDMMFGRVIIEFEHPGFLGTEAGVNHATKQVIGYIEREEPSPDEQRRWVGIVLDGRNIRFVRRGETDWLYTEPEDINPQNVTLMMQVLRGLNRWPLRADQLARVFGPTSPLAHDTIVCLLQHLYSSPSVDRLFSEWRRLFGQVAQYNLDQNRGLREYAAACPGADASHILFALHTYYALIIKLVCAELATLYTRGAQVGYLERLAVMPADKLKLSLDHLEDGGTLSDLGVRNVLEGDFFSWYLAAWDTSLATAVGKILQNFQRFEATEAILEPASTRDLLRQLYHQLIPQQLRHDLGEVYTPEWLAEQVLNDLDYHGDKDQRLLDPSGGTGMFIMVAMRRLRIKNTQLTEAELLKLILRNLVIFDLNPLAVVAARMNYMLNLGLLLQHRPATGIEIPVYLADSVFAPSIVPGTAIYEYKLNTASGIIDLVVPSRFIENGALGPFMTTIERAVMADWTHEFLLKRICRDMEIDSEEIDCYKESVCRFYDQLRSISTEDRLRRVYARIVKSYFTSVTVGVFEKICGNPPWLRWSRLPERYRKLTYEFCRQYGLFSKDAWVGGIETDISIMLTYAVAERWLKNNGELGFLITQTVFKSESAEGFRKFALPDGTPLGVQFVRDLVSIKPFAGVANRTAAFVLRKGVSTAYPVPYEVWYRKKARTRISEDMSLAQVNDLVMKVMQVAVPVYSDVEGNPSGAPWLTVSHDRVDAVRAIAGPSAYVAQKGTNSDLNSVYWVYIEEKLENGLLVIRPSNLGDHKVDARSMPVEPDCLYPLARGSDISRFRFCRTRDLYIVVPQGGIKALTPEEMMDEGMTETLAYLQQRQFQERLANRSTYRRYHSRMKGAPVYSLFNVGSYTFAKHKVVWREVQTGFEAAVLSPANDRYLGLTTVVPDHKLMLIACTSKNEAHYVCAMLNAKCVHEFIRGYAIGT